MGDQEKSCKKNGVVPLLARDLKVVGEYDWVLIDGAPKIAKLSAVAVKVADLVLIPVQPSPFDVWACADLVEMVASNGSTGFLFSIPKVTREEHPLTNALMLDYLGLPKDEKYPVVTYINLGSAAEKSGLRRGDRIYKIGDKSALAKRKEIRQFNHITGRMKKTSRLGWYNRLRHILKKMPENKQVPFQVKRRTQSAHPPDWRGCWTRPATPAHR